SQLEEQLQALQSELAAHEARREVNVQRVREAEEAVQNGRLAHEAAAAEAEATVERYENLQLQYADVLTSERDAELADLAQEAEVLVDRASQLEGELEQATLDLASIET